MIIFKHRDEIPKARLPAVIATYIEKLFTSILRSVPDFNPEHDGQIILTTPGETDKALCEKIGRRWSDSCFEGVIFDHESQCYHAVLLHNNQYTVSIIAPAGQLDPAVKERLDRELATPE